MRSVSAAGAISAAPAPWTALPVSSAGTLVAEPAMTDPTKSVAQPAANTRRAPSRSDRRPPSSSRPPNATTYALKTHDSSVGSNLSDCRMWGRATPMIDVSMITTNCAAAIKPSAHHRRLLNSVGDVVAATVVSFAGSLALPGLRSMTAMSCRCRGRGHLLISTTAGQQRAAHVSAARRRSPDISGDCVRRLSPHRIRPRVRREIEVTSMEIRLLGPVEVRNGADRQAPAGRGERALLALLALSPGQVVATTTLIDALWEPDGLPDDPGNALQLRVSKLRRVLAVLGAPDVIDRDGAGYRLGVEPDAVDVQRFSRLIEVGRRTGDANRAVAAYDAALGLWRGEPLIDFAGEHWTTVETVRLNELRLSAVAERAERLLTLGSYERVAADLEPIVAEAPTREKLVGQLMTALFNAGRQAAAVGLLH